MTVETATLPAPAQRPPAGGGPRHSIRPGRRLVFLLVGLLILAALAAWALLAGRAPRTPAGLVASGTVEADEVLIGSEVLGRVVELPIGEGRAVRAGDVVVRLDDDLIQLQLQLADVATNRQLKIQAERYTLRAPVSGVMTRVPARVGEVASPGQPLVVVADLRHLKLIVYVLVRDLDRVHVGQTASIAADPFADRTFAGRVTSINSRAEFTPRNVQTQRDRLNLVFGVQLRVDNPDGALKPGMPVDATLLPPDEAIPPSPPSPPSPPPLPARSTVLP
jgi:HlyD family secretion protein